MTPFDDHSNSDSPPKLTTASFFCDSPSRFSQKNQNNRMATNNASTSSTNPDADSKADSQYIASSSPNNTNPSQAQPTVIRLHLALRRHDRPEMCDRL